ncbi:Coiled-coil domain-containing protein 30 [Anabarilius grahami]|uniref:Coiled-coil domain-containing protein 30 n=1 Tax=Anabarilius grahami TaxID=495550 RepID=A0A3N0XG29_ANAGA|nr:Coiled-coil domain-containing protein 30 [Anabarilius grahami]
MLQDMEQRLQEEGLDPSASVNERLSLLWQLYKSSESTVKSLNQQIQDLQKERVAEIEKVQQYINHIKSLTKTRDSVALHLEQENITLRSTLDDIHLQQEAQRSEVSEMLLQEGLADIIPISLSEQVAYLLADRASLLEKIQSQDDVDVKTAGDPDVCKEQTSQDRGDNVVKAVDLQCSGDDKLKGQTLQELERDVDEASARLAMAHKEIRRLTDELESAHLTQKAYEPELQEAQMEVEHLRHEVEKLKRCEVAELRKTKEINEKQEEELCHLRLTVKRLQEEHAEAPDSTFTPSKGKKLQEVDIHKRCLDEMQERLIMLQDLTQVTLKLRMEFEMEADLRRRAVDECEEQKRKRTDAEQLVRDFQNLCEKQADDYRTTVGSLQVEIRDLVSKVRELEVQDVERQCDKHLKQLSSLDDEVRRLKFDLQEERQKTRQLTKTTQMEIDQARALVQSQEVQLQQDAEEQRSLFKELQGIQNILSTTEQELLSQRRNNTQLQNSISHAEQENLRLQQDINDLRNRLTSSQQETDALRTELQLALVSVDAEKSKYNDKRIHHKNKLSRARGVYLRETGWRDEKIKELEKEIFILRKQEEKTSRMMTMVTSENESLLQKNRDLLLQLHDFEEAQKNASDTVSSMQIRINFLEEENGQLQQTTAQMSEHIECLTILAETSCDEVSAESRVIEGEDQTTLPNLK